MAIISLPAQKPKTLNWDKFFDMYREPIDTYCITPNNSPTKEKQRSAHQMKRRMMGMIDDDEFNFEDVSSDMLLNTITGLFSKFYLPERIRFVNNGIKIKMNDVVSYKVVFQDGTMKFYLTVPQKWSKNFINAIKRDWGQVDINLIDTEVIDFNPTKAKAMNIVMRNHHCLSIKHGKGERDTLYSALSSIGSTITKEDKMIIDFNVTPLANSWKDDAIREFKKAKTGKPVFRKDASIATVVNAVLGFANTIMDEAVQMINDLMSIGGGSEDKSVKEESKFTYTQEKLHANANGFQVQIKAIAESQDSKKAKHLLKGVQNAFEQLNGDNKFAVKHIRTRRGIKTTIECVKKSVPRLGYGKDIFCEKEMNQMFKIPSKQTLKEFGKIIDQDSFTRTDIPQDFLDNQIGALPFAQTLDKEPKIIHFPTYEREDWTDKGRKVLKKTQLDDRCTETLVFGKKGSGKTELSVNQGLETFLAGATVSLDEWKKRSKSVVAFDVTDGEILTKMWNQIPTWLRHRVIILNHAVHERPIPVNFAELDEFNRVTLNDPDYSYRLAEIESDLISEILKSDNVEKSLLVERWFKYSLQCVHHASPDWGIPEAIKMLIDDDFRIIEVMPKIADDPELLIEMEAYNIMAANGENSKIVNPMQNRLSQIKAERKLWDCIAQKPMRDDEGKSVINFRKWCDGDADGAYLVMVYIPKDASKKFRKFLFAHYFIKIWSVATSREKGFAGREYRPEAFIIVDEIHQIIDVPIIARIFIDLFKEVRKYSFRFWFTLHGWSSLSKAGRGLEGDLKQSIMDNGANLIMLKGGEEAFESLENFMGDMTIYDYNNLMNMKFCGIFSIQWAGQHVFQGRMLPEAMNRFKTYDKWDLYDLSNYVSPYSRSREEVRKENLERIHNLIKSAILQEHQEPEIVEGLEWDALGQDGTNG